MEYNLRSRSVSFTLQLRNSLLDVFLCLQVFR